METYDTQSRNKPVSYTIPVVDQFKTPVGLQQPSLCVRRSSDIDSDSDVDSDIAHYRSMGKRRYMPIRGKVSKLHKVIMKYSSYVTNMRKSVKCYKVSLIV